MSQNEVRVRFAPSPTGYLHIGGARTALYNWLFARHCGGTFILRIEDTDRNRYVPDALDDIMASLRWLGIDWDEGPEVGGGYGSYFQSERLDLYQKYAGQLVDEGKAYRCYCTSERLEQLRKEQETNKQWVGYDRYCLNMTDGERREKEASGAKSVIRFKIPREGRTLFQDMIRGELGFDNSILDDFVLLKSDGFPTYHLANVIDDHSMKISHVMRGDEWIPSTPRHVLLYQAFGWNPPQYAHLPIFLAPGGGKLSKRHGATSVREYREKGYLPEALFNFLLLLGWNPGTDRELFSLADAAKEFTIERINASPVALSFEKLDWFNGLYIRNLAPEDLAKHCLPYLQQTGLLPEPCPEERYKYLVQLMPLVRERLKSIPEITDLASYFLMEEIPAPAKELLIPKKMDAAQSLQALEGALEALKAVGSDFKEADLEGALRGEAEKLGLQDGQVFMPLRVAISGRTATPGIFETLSVLGKERVVKRIQNAVQVLKS
jgi:glutamyl-tRNA synthetase